MPGSFSLQASIVRQPVVWRSVNVSCDTLVGYRRSQDGKSGGTKSRAGHFVRGLLEACVQVCSPPVESACGRCAGFDTRIFRGNARVRSSSEIRPGEKQAAYVFASVRGQFCDEPRKGGTAPETRRQRATPGAR